MLHLDVGLLTAQRLAGSEQPWTELYTDTVAIAEQAERLGFDGVWVSEHHFTDDGYMSALLPVLAAIATRTQRVALGTNVALAPLYHPLRLAEDAAAVDLISGGRLLLGLGIGYRDAEFDALGVPKRERVPRLLECVDVCRKAWTGEPFDHDGPLTSVGGLTIRPVPPGPPEIWLGGWVDAAIERAAAFADGYISPIGAIDDTRRRLDVLDAAAQQCGRGALPLATATWVAFDRGGGVSSSVEQGIRHLYAQYEQWYSSSSDGDGGRAVGEAIAGAATFPPGESPPGVVSGSVQQVVDALAPLAVIGEERTYRMAVRLHFPGMSRSEVFELLDVFATEVAPHLRTAAITVPSDGGAGGGGG
jgi:alkanesulfonate monooxygenase SsuD/methylene tetrahydromethanopterin reductase-like flavin-dependent oxidoreductase (luciferase family)